jgi:hypothetical protein
LQEALHDPKKRLRSAPLQSVLFHGWLRIEVFETKTTPDSGNDLQREPVTLFLASVAALYFELLTIRYLSTEVRVFANLKNLPPIASFLGIGLGMILGKPGKKLSAAFPFAGLLFFSVIRYAAYLLGGTSIVGILESCCM